MDLALNNSFTLCVWDRRHDEAKLYHEAKRYLLGKIDEENSPAAAEAKKGE